jgi:hypothetical protein
MLVIYENKELTNIWIGRESSRIAPLFITESALPCVETIKHIGGEKEKREVVAQEIQTLRFLKQFVIGRNEDGNTNIVKALGMIFGSSSSGNDQREDDEAQNDKNLHTAEIKFEFSEDSNSEIVDGNDGSKEQCHIQRWMTCGSVISTLIKPVFD